MQAPQWLAHVNKYVTNPVQRLWAGWLPGMAIVEHVGRSSGKPYRTPLIVFGTDDGLAILLTYGPDRDWLKNVMAAGHARVQRRGRTFDVGAPRVTSKAVAAQRLTGLGKIVFPRLPFEQALLLSWAD
jgi:deazaflavin-dependent oxidoreductase (nitroreductase family)